MNVLPSAPRTGAGSSEPIGPVAAAAFFVDISEAPPGASLEVTLEGLTAGTWQTIARSPRFTIPTGNAAAPHSPFVFEVGPGLGLQYANERIQRVTHEQLRVSYNAQGAIVFGVDAKVIPQ